MIRMRAYNLLKKSAGLIFCNPQSLSVDYRRLKRKGFTLVEEAIVIAIVAILALPVTTLMSETFRSQFYGAQDIKGQYAMNVIMQDIEQRIRRADKIYSPSQLDTPSQILYFSYTDADKDGKEIIDPSTNLPNSIYCVYELDTNSLFKRGIGTSPNPTLAVFPQGLEPGVIKDFSVMLSPSSPYTITITLTSPDPYDSSKEIILQKTIYLINYAQ